MVNCFMNRVLAIEKNFNVFISLDISNFSDPSYTSGTFNVSGW